MADMKKVKFLHSRKLGKTIYHPGVHSVPAEHCKGWFFEGLLKAADCVVVDESVPSSGKSVETAPKTESADGPPKPSKKSA